MRTQADFDSADPIRSKTPTASDPWLDDGDVQLYHGDAWAVLNSLPEGCAQTCVTSPPYWGLRDYGAAGQIGLEDTVDEYVRRLVEVFRAVWFALRDDGTVWLNLGDSYAGGGRGGHGGLENVPRWGKASPPQGDSEYPRPAIAPGLKAKDLVGVPWRVAFALQADGWYLRSDIIWSKPNPMPESVTDRPTKSHEYLFLLSKQPKYFFDSDAIREPNAPSCQDEGKRMMRWVDNKTDASRKDGTGGGLHAAGQNGAHYNGMGRNARSVWTVATQPTPEAHFATFPEALVRRCILAGTSERGGCSVCGAPWQRVVERTPMEIDRSERTHDRGHTRSSGTMTKPPTSETTGWAASCQCGAPPVPQTVLDPFVGSGTTALVARKHGRRAIGIDLSADYLAIAARRLGQQSLFATSGGVA